MAAGVIGACQAAQRSNERRSTERRSCCFYSFWLAAGNQLLGPADAGRKGAQPWRQQIVVGGRLCVGCVNVLAQQPLARVLEQPAQGRRDRGGWRGVRPLPVAEDLLALDRPAPASRRARVGR